MDKAYARNGHPLRFPTITGCFAYSDKPVKGRYRPVYLVDKPFKPRPGKRRLRHR
jgi:hypothetical protein